MLTRYVGRLGQAGIDQLRNVLIAALDLTEASVVGQFDLVGRAILPAAGFQPALAA
jgi:hypothetical protein